MKPVPAFLAACLTPNRDVFKSLVLACMVFLAASTGPSGADWRETVEGLRIGVVGVHNPRLALRRTAPFADYLQRAMAVGVEVIPFRSLNDLMEAQQAGRVDIAMLSATGFVDLRARCGCIEVAAVPKAHDGMSHFYAVAITRRADRVDGLDDLRGRAVALGDVRSTASRRVPEAVLAAMGTMPSEFFHRTERFDDPVDALIALVKRKLDAVFTWSSLAGDLAAGYSRGPLRRAIAEAGLGMTDVNVAWRSVAIPHGPVAIRSALPEDLKSELGRLLLALPGVDAEAYHALDPLFGGGLAAPDGAVLSEFSRLFAKESEEVAPDAAEPNGTDPKQTDAE